MSNKTTNTRTKLFVDHDTERLEQRTNEFLATLPFPPISVTFHIRPETHTGAEDYLIMVVYAEPTDSSSNEAH